MHAAPANGGGAAPTKSRRTSAGLDDAACVRPVDPRWVCNRRRKAFAEPRVTTWSPSPAERIEPRRTRLRSARVTHVASDEPRCALAPRASAARLSRAEEIAADLADAERQAAAVGRLGELLAPVGELGLVVSSRAALTLPTAAKARNAAETRYVHGSEWRGSERHGVDGC